MSPGLPAPARPASGRKRSRPKKGRLFAPPGRSGRVYARIRPSLVHLFRFHLEAADNLGIMTVVDRWGAVLMVRFSPHQEREVLEFLQGLAEVLDMEVLTLPPAKA